MIYKKIIKILLSKLFLIWMYELQCFVTIATRLSFALEETSEKLTLTQENLALLHENDNVADQPAQTDQHLFYSLYGKNSSQTCSMQNFNILVSL